MAKQRINVKGTEITLFSKKTEDYISLTDIAKHKDSERTNYIIQNWMRSRSTIEFIGLWELLHNPDFKGIEFDAFKNEAGSNSITLTPKKAERIKWRKKSKRQKAIKRLNLSDHTLDINIRRCNYDKFNFSEIGKASCRERV